MKILRQDLEVARGFAPMREAELEKLLARTASAAKGGTWEKYKTSHRFDGTVQNPRWLGEPA